MKTFISIAVAAAAAAVFMSASYAQTVQPQPPGGVQGNVQAMPSTTQPMPTMNRTMPAGSTSQMTTTMPAPITPTSPTVSTTMPQPLQVPERAPRMDARHTAIIAPLYINGGAGEEERAAMRQRSADFPQQLVLSAPGGDYAVAKTLTILPRDGSGVPLMTVHNAGPLIMMRLPPGSYVATADIDGRIDQRPLIIGGGPQQIQWRLEAALH